MASRFPFPIPFGWFCVALEAELEPGELVAANYFGRDLVIWRSELGEFAVSDAFCPHLGAHLAVGGKVHGDQLVCPFHAWEFNAAGACTNIPYSDRLNQKAKLRVYPVTVRNGFVFAWYHPHDEEPSWEIPAMDEVVDPAWTDYYSFSYTIKTAAQEMSENGADPAHFKYVHGTDTVAELVSYDTGGTTSTMLSKQSYVTPKGVEWGRIDVYNHGPGFSQVYFEIPGLVEAWNLATTSPIDAETTQVRFNFIVKRHESAEFTDVIAKAFVKEINKQICEDTPIWENKVFLQVPSLADTDGPILKFRKWYSQFYAA